MGSPRGIASEDHTSPDAVVVVSHPEEVPGQQGIWIRLYSRCVDRSSPGVKPRAEWAQPSPTLDGWDIRRGSIAGGVWMEEGNVCPDTPRRRTPWATGS